MRMTVKVKALFIMIPFLVIVSLIHTWQSIRIEKRIVRSEIIKRAEAITTLATRTGELPILSGNPELLKNTVEFLRANSEVSSVTFYDSSLKMLIHDGAPAPAPMTAPPPDLPISMTDDPGAFVFYAPVFTVIPHDDYDIVGGVAPQETREKIGWIRLSFGKAVMQEYERRIATQGLLLATGFAIGSSIMVYFLITLATRPLAGIVKIADDISHGNFDRKVENERQDEFGTLSRAFHAMKGSIHQVLQETNTLMHAVQEGRLESRGNAEAFEGSWRELVTGVNGLADAFARINHELQVSKEHAEAASRAKSEFLANMSHELRTPLNAIMGYAQILQLYNPLGEEQKQQLEIIHNSGEHLLTLINDILDVGKIEAQKMELEEVSFNLPMVLRQVFSLARIRAEEKDIGFRYEELTPLPEYVRGDERKLKQVILNLLGNAVRYTTRGSVTLRVAYDPRRPGLFSCHVVDTGRGIPKDKLETIFEPFTQLATNRQSREGTGLGLTITRHLVDLMKGRLDVESEPGKGSTFRFEMLLPTVTDGEIDQAEKLSPIAGYRGARRKILIVDDNVANVSMLVSLLEPLGFEVSTAENGVSAVAAALDDKPDLVLLDLVMPGGDGLEAAGEMRRHPELDGVRVIGVSASDAPKDCLESFMAACDAFLSKPIKMDLLCDRIRELLGIEWEFANMGGAGPAENSPVVTLQEIEVPPIGKLSELHEFAMRGDMRRIHAWAATLAEEEPDYAAFARQIMELARSFQTRAILAMLDEWRGKG